MGFKIPRPILYTSRRRISEAGDPSREFVELGNDKVKGFSNSGRAVPSQGDVGMVGSSVRDRLKICSLFLNGLEDQGLGLTKKTGYV